MAGRRVVSVLEVVEVLNSLWRDIVERGHQNNPSWFNPLQVRQDVFWVFGRSHKTHFKVFTNCSIGGEEKKGILEHKSKNLLPSRVLRKPYFSTAPFSSETRKHSMLDGAHQQKEIYYLSGNGGYFAIITINT